MSEEAGRWMWWLRGGAHQPATLHVLGIRMPQWLARHATHVQAEILDDTRPGDTRQRHRATGRYRVRLFGRIPLPWITPGKRGPYRVDFSY